MEVTNFISGPVEYDKYGATYFWINCKEGGKQMLAEMRGWGAIQNLAEFQINTPPKGIDFPAAAKFQDKVGAFIAEAINEKIEREKPKT